MPAVWSRTVRNRIQLFASASLPALLASVLAFGSAQALPPGNVLSNQKISDTAGNFTPIIDNLDEFGESIEGLGDPDGAGPAVDCNHGARRGERAPRQRPLSPRAAARTAPSARRRPGQSRLTPH